MLDLETVTFSHTLLLAESLEGQKRLIHSQHEL